MLLLLTACTLWDDTPYRENVLRLTDADGDGVTLAEGDCNDTDPDVHPGAVDVCDGDDNDCDGETDEIPPDTVWCQDVDGDGFGDAQHQTRTCYPSTGWVMDCTDCDDAAPLVNPDGTEACNGVDDNCDGTTDPDGAAGSTTWYVDRDGDGYGGADIYAVSCEQPPGTVDDTTDCDDTEEDTNPGAEEICGDGRDNNCDGSRNECGWSGEKVLDTTMASFIEGPEASGEYLGFTLGIVDTNADGVGDIILYGGGDSLGIRDGGVLHVWTGAPTGRREIDEASAHLAGTPDLLLGYSTYGAPVLPIDEFGVDELLIAASGYARDFDEDGTILRVPAGIFGSAVAAPETVWARGDSYWEGFGENFVRADGWTDGVPSLLVAAPYNEERTGRGGAVYLVSFTEPNAVDAIARVMGVQEGDLLGQAALGFGEDLDGDGTDDLILASGGRDDPALFVLRGPISGDVLVSEAEYQVTDASLTGWDATAIPDLDGDGLPDIVVGASDRILFLDGAGQGSVGLSEAQLGYLSDEYADPYGINYGLGLGDIHGDGTMDLVIGAPDRPFDGKAGSIATAGGLAVVPLDQDFSGGPDLWESADASFLSPEYAGLGFRVAVGDVNADGFDDVLASAPNWSGTTPYAGGAWFILGGGI